MRGRRQILTVAAAVGLWLAWTSLGRAITPASAQGGAQSTVIWMDNSATGFFDRHVEFKWDLDASMDQSSVEIRPGQSCDVQTTIKVTRSMKTQTDQCGVRALVCVLNAGGACTQNLEILDQVQFLGQDGWWHALKTCLIDCSAKPMLQPGEQFTFPCQITFTPPDGCTTFRNVVQACISNFTGWFQGMFCGPIGGCSFCPPSTPNLIQVDCTAQVCQQTQCPNGFTRQDSCSTKQFNFTNTGSLTFTSKFTNQSAQGGQQFALTNPATLLPCDTGQQQQVTDTAPLQISTGPAPTTPSLTFTTIQLDSSATGFFDRCQQFNWSLDASIDPGSVEIKTGQFCDVHGTLKVLRLLHAQTDQCGVRGQICVTNAGQGPTQNLTILDQVQFLGQDGWWHVLKTCFIDTSPKCVLQGGEQFRFPFLIKCAAPDGCLALRNVVLIAITNFTGCWPGVLAGPVGAWSFGIPGTPNITQIDPTSLVSLQTQSLRGFTCQCSCPSGQFSFTNSGTVTFTNRLTNLNVKAGQSFTLTNPVTLVPSDSGQQQQQSDTAPLHVSTGTG